MWVRSFETIEELRLALLEFKRTLQRAVDAGEVRLSQPRLKCDATSSAWTRLRRNDYLQITVPRNPGAIHNTRRLLGPLGDIPPAEFEAQYYEQAEVA